MYFTFFYNYNCNLPLTYYNIFWNADIITYKIEVSDWNSSIGSIFISLIHTKILFNISFLNDMLFNV